MDTLRSMGHDTAKLWEAIGQLVTKTLVSVQPHLEHTYYTCRQRSDDAGFGCFEARPLATPAPLRGALPHAPLLLPSPFHPSYPFQLLAPPLPPLPPLAWRVVRPPFPRPQPAHPNPRLNYDPRAQAPQVLG